MGIEMEAMTILPCGHDQGTYKGECRVRIRERNRAYGAAHPRDRRAEARTYDAAHREERKAWRAAHVTERAAYDATYRTAHPRPYASDAGHREQDCERQHRRRVRRFGNGVFAILRRDWRRALHRYGQACAYCGVSGVPLHQEHVVPVVRGGRHSIGNLLPACASCNFSKGSKFLVEWRADRAKQGRSPQAPASAATSAGSGSFDYLGCPPDSVLPRGIFLVAGAVHLTPVGQPV